jgi:hypothetical protein
MLDSRKEIAIALGQAMIHSPHLRAGQIIYNALNLDSGLSLLATCSDAQLLAAIQNYLAMSPT